MSFLLHAIRWIPLSVLIIPPAYSLEDSLFESSSPAEGAVCSFEDGISSCDPNTWEAPLDISYSPGYSSRIPDVAFDEEKRETQTLPYVKELVRAGFNTARKKDERDISVLHATRISPDAVVMAELLQAFSHFPSIQKRLFAGLLEESLPKDVRFWRFEQQAFVLASTGEALLATEKKAVSTKTYLTMLQLWNAEAIEDLPADKQKIREEKYEVAVAFFDCLLDMMDKEFAEGGLADFTKIQPQKGIFPSESTFAGSAVSRKKAITSLWSNRHRVDVQELAKSVLLDDRGSPEQRLLALQLFLQSPSITLDSAFSYLSFRQDMDMLSLKWQHKGDLQQGIQYTHEIPASLLNAYAGLDQSPVKKIPLLPQGTGISLRRLATPPTMVKDKSLFLLVENTLDVPERWQQQVQAGIPVLDDTPVSFLENGPRLLALDIQKEDSRALYEWALRTGAVNGDAVLVSSQEPVELLARRLAGLFLIETNSSTILVNALSGHILEFLLREGNGLSAENLFAPEQVVWFLSAEDTGWAWYEASSTNQKTFSEPVPVVLKINAVQGAALEAFMVGTFQRIKAYSLAKRWPLPQDEGKGKAYISFFVRDMASRLDAGFAQASYLEKNKAIELLWRGKVAGIESSVAQAIFQGKGGLSERIIAAEKLLKDEKSTQQNTKK